MRLSLNKGVSTRARKDDMLEDVVSEPREYDITREMKILRIGRS